MSETLKDKVLKSLIKTKGLSKEQVDEALLLQQDKGISLDAALIEKGYIQEQDLLMLLVRELNIPFINLSKYKMDQSLKDMIPEKIARTYNIIPLSSLDTTLTVALSDPLNVFVIDDLKSITGKDIDVVMSTQTEILKAIEAFYGSDAKTSMTDISKNIDVDDINIIIESDEDGNQGEFVDESEKAPVVRMVNLILKEAIRQRASDIHLEPMKEKMRVRYRVDGVLLDILDVPKDSVNTLIVRIKILSALDITTRFIPQDGRFKLKIQNREIDFRVSLLPTTYGEKVVMRILDKGSLSVGLGGLGISERGMASLEAAIKKPFGMILVTGPTGSGKSTTLYSIINELNQVDKNIITVEDPVEYLIDGLTQIHARPDIGLTFAEGLKSILRQSPDVVMVGEIRDNETADIAIKASLTGQLVFSTLHTNDAAGAMTRLVDMGVEPFLVASSLVLISAQRLCRKICESCKEEVKIEQSLLDQFNYEFGSGAKFHQGKGCEQCKNSGYLGRMCVTEILDVDDVVRSMLIKGHSSDDIKEYARKEKGMYTLYEDAMEKCLSGYTTLEEVLRITSSD